MTWRKQGLRNQLARVGMAADRKVFDTPKSMVRGVQSVSGEYITKSRTIQRGMRIIDAQH